MKAQQALAFVENAIDGMNRETLEAAAASLAAEVRRLRDEVNGLTGSLDRAEAALKEAREQEPVDYKWLIRDSFGKEQLVRKDQLKENSVILRAHVPVYTRPTPAPAVAVPSDVARCIRESRQLAMDMVIKARIPESGDFAVIAQSLDYVADWLQSAQQDDSGNGDSR